MARFKYSERCEMLINFFIFNLGEFYSRVKIDAEIT